MKNRILALIALGVAAVGLTISALPSSAGIASLGRLKWNRGISSYGAGVTDSTRISIPAASAAVDFADTTAWVDLNTQGMVQTYTQQALLVFQINKQLTTTTDSIGYVVQYTNDVNTTSNTNIFSTTAAYITSVAASTQNVATGADGTIGLVVAVAPKTNPTGGAITTTQADFPWRFARLVVYNSDTSGATGRSYFSVDAVLSGSK